MDRRRFVLSSTAGVVGSALNRTLEAAGQRLGLKPSTEESGELFPSQSLSARAWAQFTAAGFTEPVIYRKSKPAECGLPLGAIDTGGIDLDTDGTFGYCSMFGSFIPPRGPLRQPFLGIRVGKQTWVLATRHTEEIENVKIASEIHYWGHYYQNMMLWALPAAIENADLHGPCAPGGRVDRIIQAGSKA